MSCEHLKSLCQKHLKAIPPNLLQTFNQTIFPLSPPSDPLSALANHLSNSCFNKTSLKADIGAIRQSILLKAKKIDVTLYEQVRQLLSEETFSEECNLEDETAQPEPPTIDYRKKSKEKEKTISKSPQRVTSKMIFTQTLPSIKEGCICGKIINQSQRKKELTFKCIHCEDYYHFDCMRKPINAKTCSICHLKLMFPNKTATKTLFLGMLRKGKHKHQISFQMNEDDLKQRKVEVRSLRLKDCTQQFILFPDSLSIAINDSLFKEYEPIHKQSSIKYRKDELLYIPMSKLKESNKFVLLQRSSGSKDERLQYENHLLGIYLTTEVRISTLAKQIKGEKINTYEQSKALLESCFQIGEEVSCEQIKIPLTCPLSTERIKCPARTILCKHFQCFDLDNLLRMVSVSANPRWLCPICKQSAYSFQVDCILAAIIKSYPSVNVTEVMFDHQGKFTVYEMNQVSKGEEASIQDLRIENKGKRQREDIDEKEKEQMVVDLDDE